MNKEIKEILDEYEDSSPLEKTKIKMLYSGEDINHFDVDEWEKITGKKSSW